MKTEIVEFKGREIYCPVIDGQIYVAIKPICESIGILPHKQVERIKSDELLSRLIRQVSSTGRDDKSRMMSCLPLQYIFGWMFTIDVGLVKEEARELVMEYKTECYNALYEHFIGRSARHAKREDRLARMYSQIDTLDEVIQASKKQKKELLLQIRELSTGPVDQLDMFLDQPDTGDDDPDEDED